jgi:hypothetical protein
LADKPFALRHRLACRNFLNNTYMLFFRYLV